MAEPKFTSQQSVSVLNVSEDHSSSPLAESHAHAQTHVEQSPTIQASSVEAIIPKSAEFAERIEDSYQDSLRPPVTAPLTGDEEEEDLYGVSPSGEAKLKTAVAAIKSTQEEPVWYPYDRLKDESLTFTSRQCRLRAISSMR
jgi:hypothetical protein